MSIYDLEVAAAGSDGIVLTLEGTLDSDAGRQLLETATIAAGADVVRIEIVLDGLESFTSEGIAALSACARLPTSVPGGITLRAGGGPGKQALLAACSHPDPG